MAKTTAPLLSFGASGQIAKTQVYSKWKGRSYARRYTVPANPNSAEQILTRSTFAFLQNVYKYAPPDLVAPWDEYARGLVMTGRNAMTKLNLTNLREEANLDLMLFSPGALGGLPPATITVTPGNDQLTVACAAPASVPTGWTLFSAILGVLRDGDPQTSAFYQAEVFEDVAAPFTHDFTALVSAVTYQCFAFLKWTRPDGRIAYSPSISDTGLTT